MIFGRHINKYYKKYFLFFLIGILALLAVDFFQLLIPEICGKLLDGVNPENGSPLLKEENIKLVNNYMIGLLIIAIVMVAGRFTWRYTINGVGARIESDIRDDMFKHGLILSNEYYKVHKTGALMALFTNDLQTLRRAVGSGTIFLIDAIFLGAFSFYKMIRVNYILALLSIIPMIFIIIASLFVGKIMKNKYTKRQEAYEQLSDFTQENFSGIRVIKAFVKEVIELHHFDKINKNNYDKNMSFIRFSILLDVLLTAFLSLVIAILFFGGAYFVINEYKFFGTEFTSGKLFEFIGYFDTLIWPFLAISMLIQMRAQAKASYQRVSEFLDSKPDIVNKEDALDIKLEGKIEYRNLTFRYPDSNFDILSNISFTIEKGMMVGIVGKTGSGKSTLVDLLLRTYNLENNQILMDDHDIMDINFKNVREAIGYCQQDTFLFSDSIKNNIAFAKDDINMDEIDLAADLSDVKSNIIEFDNKYDTILGEKGVTLSGGQKQRISIARSIIKDPKILILDDSLSAVDTKTEDIILSNLRKIRQNKTTIIVANRISTVKDLDLVILIDDGKLAGIGKHNDLLKTNEIYKEMVSLQELEKEVNDYV